MSASKLAGTAHLGGTVSQAPRLSGRRVAILVALILIYGVIPIVGNDYWLNSLIIPTIVMGLAGLGLNLLMGYAGLISLGSAAFMATGAFATFNLLLRLPILPLPVVLILAGLIAGLGGLIFGLPSLRIRGFYLSAPTLAAQFFLTWLFQTYHWFSNNSMSLVISAPRLEFFGYDLSSSRGRYLLVALTAGLLLLLAFAIIKSRIGRDWMAIRDMEVAASVTGVPIARRKLQAYVVSSFFLGVAGALWAFAYLGTADSNTFSLDKSFQVLFIVLIGGSASLLGNFVGAAFIVLTPIVLDILVPVLGLDTYIDQGSIANIEPIIFGALIIFLLIKEPDGLASLFSRTIRALSIWPLRR
ncbi:branched-chain amino acid ABC transporter permease [Acidisoma silvae]|uniref:Branched-chain amino acid ABC transporter permease n=1 Tax=Acidisoma silvae TaxID=2802396 RepID=A0A963YUR6_9PROT|nr:branched-chain amino acid ABC transporter permease [Acidisoma silvae]MCB8876927.1 branched-chain amino acid ABC transporter permease [Acidisoma silvae]